MQSNNGGLDQDKPAAEPALGPSLSRARTDIAVCTTLAILAVGLPVVLAAVSGAATIPHSDDFSYRKVAMDLHSSGNIRFNGWVAMNLVGQLLIVQPFLWVSGGSPWAFAIATSVLTVVGIAAAYALVRSVASTSVAAFSILSLILFPGVLVYTTSFMTDIPALAGEFTCLTLGAVALGRDGRSRWAWLIASLAVGCFAFSIREFALAAPVAVLIAVMANDPRRLGRYLVAAAATLVVCGATFLYASGLPGQGKIPIAFSLDGIARIRFAAATLGLAASPAIVLALARLPRRLVWRSLVLGIAAGALAYHWEIATFLSRGVLANALVGDMLSRLGTPDGAAAGARPVLLGSPLWGVLDGIGMLAISIGFGILATLSLEAWLSIRLRGLGPFWEFLGTTRGMITVFAALYAGGLIVFDTLAPFFDRYLWPLAIPVAYLLVTLAGDRRTADQRAADPTQAPGSNPWRTWLGVAVAGMLVVVLAATSAATLLNADAFDTAGWRMGQEAVARGYSPQTVDAGMAWTGYYAEGLATVTAPHPRDLPWYENAWPSFHLCALVSSSELSGANLRLEYVQRDAYRLLLFVGPTEPLYLYAVTGPGCP